MRDRTAASSPMQVPGRASPAQARRHRVFPVPGVLVSLLLAVSAHSQAQSKPADTLDVARLRAEVKAHPDSFPLVLALGTALARSATERSSDWRLRLEARKYLGDALRMRGGDPRPLFEIGMLMRKQGMRTDALRALNRAGARMARSGGDLNARELAEVHYQMGLAFETRWEDGEHLGLLNSAFAVGSCSAILRLQDAWVSLPSNPRVLLNEYNVLCPEVFDELMANWVSLDGYEVDYVSMLEHFRETLRLDSTRSDVAFRLLRHMAAHQTWEEYLEVAEALARRLPDDPNVLLYLGLGYHLTGRPERADSAFTLAIARAPADRRDELLDPVQLMPTHDSVTFLALSEPQRMALGDIYWRARDPLFLTPGNERLAEHLARLAYVDVAYGAPESGTPGRWTPRGAAWLRYGEPLQIRAIGSGDQWGTIYEYWDYGAGSPDLVFVRHRTYRWARVEELSDEYLRYARDRVPELYAPEHPRLVATIPFQAAAFRNHGGGGLIEVYAALPVSALRTATDAPEIQTGVFVVTGDFWEPRGAVRRTQAADGDDSTVDAALPVTAGDYVVSLEAVAGDVAAQRRVRISVPDFDHGLVLSDLLLADRFASETATADDRADLAPVVSRTLVFPREASIGVLWEIYGLQTDSLGAARYHVRAEVANDSHKTVDIAVAPGDGRNRIEWDAARRPRADGAMVEHVTLRLPGAKPGSYRVFITVTDLLTGQTFTAHQPMAIGR